MDKVKNIIDVKKTIENAEELIKSFMKDEIANPCDYCTAEGCSECSRYTENDEDELNFKLEPVEAVCHIQ